MNDCVFVLFLLSLRVFCFMQEFLCMRTSATPMTSLFGVLCYNQSRSERSVMPRTCVVFRLLIFGCTVYAYKAERDCWTFKHLTSGRNVQAKGQPPSEFRCPARWGQNWEKMRNKLTDKLKDEDEKKFIRFRAPVQGYSNPHLGLRIKSGYVTWVWVADKFRYMLYYPHNFETLSLATTSIICADLREKDLRLDCSHCGNVTNCGIGKFELEVLMVNVSVSLGLKWEYLCVEADYGMSDIVGDYSNEQNLQMLNTRNFAVPDILYQWRFLMRLFRECTWLGMKCNKNLHNYYCYNRDGNCVVKEVMENYFVIVYLAVGIWLFSPLLVYYLPSSEPFHSQQYLSDMFPTYKTPVHLGRFIQCVFCYYTPRNQYHAKWPVRLRRVLCLVLLAGLSFRHFIHPAYHYKVNAWLTLALFFIAILIPDYLSEHIQPEPPTNFPLFAEMYPEGVIKWSARKEGSKEYQRLAYVMQERIFALTDQKFQQYLFRNSFPFDLHGLNNQSLLLWLCKLVVGSVTRLVIFIFAIIVVLLYYVVPMPYFVKELLCAIWKRVHKYCTGTLNTQSRTLSGFVRIYVSVFHGTILSVLLGYFILTLFSLSYLITEVTLFTYIGANITPNKAMEYVVLLTAAATALYTMVYALHKEYNNLLEDTVTILENEKCLEYVRQKITSHANTHLVKADVCGSGTQISLVQETLYYKKGFVTHIRTELYFFIVECLRPIRRQVLLLIIKVLLMLFFILLAMWVKNVYKSESKVSDIFTLASNVAVYFIPSALQVLSYRGHFGKRAEALQKVEVADAVVKYIDQKM